MQSRPAIVVVLGHVDHGKTTLLDAIRSADVASKEYGGITQGIGAYQVSVDSKKITFIDTPGHEAFSQMRSRGANVADIAILVVSASDSVMPQTVESIKIIQAAGIPYIVAINKVDLPEANVDKVIHDLVRHEVMLENYGGQVPFLKVSAKKKEGIKELLDLIELMAEVNGLSGDPKAPLEATVIESKLDKNRGPVATVVVRNGTLKVGEEIYIDNQKSKIRALIDYQGQQLKEAGPGTPVEIVGLTVVPIAGTALATAPGEVAQVHPDSAKTRTKTEDGALNLILKADTLGSLEAITATIPPNVNLLEGVTGEITEADILLAKSTGAIILGFNTKVNASALKLAQTEKILVRTYKIIYELLDELKDAAAGMLAPVTTEETLGVGEIIAEFPYEKLRVAGVKVTDGRMARGDLVRVSRHVSREEETAVGQAKIKTLRLAKEEANRVEKGKECGILIEPQIDFRVGDAIISYRLVRLLL